MEILDVDLAAFEHGGSARRSAVVDGVMRSLATGFVYVAHDLDEGLLDRAYDALEAFFGLPQERKDLYKVPGSHGSVGYTGLLTETAASSDIPDFKEMLNWGEERPPGHPLREHDPIRSGPQTLPERDLPGVTALLSEFHARLLALQRRVLRIIAVGLGADEGYFDEMMECGSTLTRAIHYPPMSAAPGPGHVWAEEHGDINLITALPRATAAGLQVRTDQGWVAAEPPDGSAVVNTGMMLERVSNGAIPTGIHRVVASDDDTGDRYSVVQFAHPAPWIVLTPMASCITEDRPLRYPSISAADALAKVIWEINLVEHGRRVPEDRSGLG